jgi:hypothetical protein
MHPLHEVAIGEVPLLEHDPVPCALDNVADRFSEQRVGAGPANEEIRKGLCGRVWGPVHAASPEISGSYPEFIVGSTGAWGRGRCLRLVIADIPTHPRHVCFTPKADIRESDWYVNRAPFTQPMKNVGGGGGC